MSAMALAASAVLPMGSAKAYLVYMSCATRMALYVTSPTTEGM